MCPIKAARPNTKLADETEVVPKMTGSAMLLNTWLLELSKYSALATLKLTVTLPEAVGIVGEIVVKLRLEEFPGQI